MNHSNRSVNPVVGMEFEVSDFGRADRMKVISVDEYNKTFCGHWSDYESSGYNPTNPLCNNQPWSKLVDVGTADKPRILYNGEMGMESDRAR